MRLALVFPGQGSQSVGMGHALTDAAAVEVFRTADTALGHPLSALIADGPAERLDQTEHAQPAILATSIALYRAWSEAAAAAGLPAPVAFAGHSMGQYSAMVAAGVLDLSDAIRLARVRGTLMQASPDGAMAAIIGLDDARIPELEAIGSAEGVFTVANRNSPGQIVVSGARAAVQAAADAAKGLGAKRGLVLPVSVAAHSPLMAGAADAMRGELADIAFRDPIAPLLANADARPLTTGEACRQELIEHLTRGVD
ncbi:MAG: ACP S-malonyltransferase, partial [Chloroflexi bacterium]|nr:ACP S-malonyltransferase [Chloroflexota bacterium]